MKATKASELKDKSLEELQELLLSERTALYQTRRDLVFRRIVDSSAVKARRHNVARILTLINQKKREAK